MAKKTGDLAEFQKRGGRFDEAIRCAAYLAPTRSFPDRPDWIENDRQFPDPLWPDGIRHKGAKPDNDPKAPGPDVYPD